MKIWRNFVIGITILFVIGVLRIPILHAVTAAYNQTVRIVDQNGNVLNGVASALVAPFNETVRVVDQNGNVISAFTNGPTSIPVPVNQGGTGNTSPTPAQFTYLAAGASGNYTTPTGATALDVCIAAPGGPGGAVISGGSTGIGGGNGSSGQRFCFWVYSPSGTYAYSVGAVGTPGTCAVSPSIAIQGGNTTFIVGALTLTASAGSIGATTANNSTNGTGGAAVGACNAQLTGDTAVPRYDCLGGAAGANGNGATQVTPATLGGGSGGQGYTVTSGGVCSLAATAGTGGWIKIIAYGTSTF